MTATASFPSTDLFERLNSAPAAARACLKLLQKIKHGSLTVKLPTGEIAHFGQAGQIAQLHASIHIHDWRVCSAAMKSGDIGFAESYIVNDWTTPQLADLLRLFIANRNEVEDAIYGSWLGRLAYRIKHLLNRNSKANSQKNIHAHYDLGNAFYSEWLDASMSYSSAYFDGDFSKSMSYAQHAKVVRALSMADVQANSRVLEIGCGWGGLAEIAATHFKAHTTGVTLSSEQLEFAKNRMANKNISHLTDLRFQDYRDIQDAPFDAIVSIEMIEAVGKEFWPQYFSMLHRLLKNGGRACIQAITIDDALFERYIRSTDFIQQYIFPGGCLPSPSEFRKAAQQAGFKVVDELSFGRDYAETCRRWRADFLNAKEKIKPLGFDEKFVRTWEFYLAYCEAAFDERNTDVMQFTLLKE